MSQNMTCCASNKLENITTWKKPRRLRPWNGKSCRFDKWQVCAKVWLTLWCDLNSQVVVNLSSNSKMSDQRKFHDVDISSEDNNTRSENNTRSVKVSLLRLWHLFCTVSVRLMFLQSRVSHKLRAVSFVTSFGKAPGIDRKWYRKLLKLTLQNDTSLLQGTSVNCRWSSKAPAFMGAPDYTSCNFQIGSYPSRPPSRSSIKFWVCLRTNVILLGKVNPTRIFSWTVHLVNSSPNSSSSQGRAVCTILYPRLRSPSWIDIDRNRNLRARQNGRGLVKMKLLSFTSARHARKRETDRMIPSSCGGDPAAPNIFPSCSLVLLHEATISETSDVKQPSVQRRFTSCLVSWTWWIFTVLVTNQISSDVCGTRWQCSLR